jgi:hypothetical protein
MVSRTARAQLFYEDHLCASASVHGRAENPRVSDGGHREGRLWWRCDTPPQTAEEPMTDDRIALVELLQKSCDRDVSEP